MSEQPKIKIHGMDLEEFSMQPFLHNRELSLFNFEVSAQTRLIPEIKVIAIAVGVKIREEKDTQNVFATIKTVVGFEIDNFQELITQDEKGVYNVPFKVEAMARRIAISTTRGVMFSYLKGTYLNKAILPIIPELLKPKKAN